MCATLFRGCALIPQVSTLGSHLGDVAQSTARVQRCVVHLPVLVSLIVQLLLLVDIIEMLAGGSLVD